MKAFSIFPQLLTTSIDLASSSKFTNKSLPTQKKLSQQLSPFIRQELKKVFFNLGFNNRWKKILPKEILHKLNNAFQKDINELGYEEIQDYLNSSDGDWCKK